MGQSYEWGEETPHLTYCLSTAPMWLDGRSGCLLGFCSQLHWLQPCIHPVVVTGILDPWLSQVIRSVFRVMTVGQAKGQMTFRG